MGIFLRQSVLVGIILFLSAVCLAPLGVATEGKTGQRREQDGFTESIVKGTIARGEAVFSGRIEYHLKCGFANRQRTVRDDDYRLSFSGTSWALRFSNGAAHISHRGKFIAFEKAPQSDGRVDHSATIETERRIDKTRPIPPYYAGTVWFESTKKFIRSNAASARTVGKGDVDGVPVEIIEWLVGKEQAVSRTASPFYSLDAELVKGGILLLYVAPQLGYALPRIEHVRLDGSVQARFDSRGFKEVTPGIFFPRECSLQYFGPGGGGAYERVTLKRVEKINEPIPEEDFLVEVPVGTTVGDARDVKKPVHFRIAESEPLPVRNLGNVVVVAAKEPSSWAGNTVLMALLMGLGFGTLVSAVLYLLVRRRYRSA